MSEAQVRRLPVIDEEERLCGIVSLGDLSRETDERLRKRGAGRGQRAGRPAPAISVFRMPVPARFARWLECRRAGDFLDRLIDQLGVGLGVVPLGDQLGGGPWRRRRRRWRAAARPRRAPRRRSCPRPCACGARPALRRRSWPWRRSRPPRAWRARAGPRGPCRPTPALASYSAFSASASLRSDSASASWSRISAILLSSARADRARHLLPDQDGEHDEHRQRDPAGGVRPERGRLGLVLAGASVVAVGLRSAIAFPPSPPSAASFASTVMPVSRCDHVLRRFGGDRLDLGAGGVDRVADLRLGGLDLAVDLVGRGLAPSPRSPGRSPAWLPGRAAPPRRARRPCARATPLRSRRRPPAPPAPRRGRRRSACSRASTVDWIFGTIPRPITKKMKPSTSAARRAATGRRREAGRAEACGPLAPKPLLTINGVEDDHRDGERHQAEQLGGGEADEQPALLAVGGRRVAQRALEERAEHVADADGGGADADRRETGTDDLGGSEIHD